MDKRKIKIAGLKTLIVIREIGAFLGSMTEADMHRGEKREDYRPSILPKIDRENKETCLSIASLYEEIGNKSMSKKYWTKAKIYAHMGNLGITSV